VAAPGKDGRRRENARLWQFGYKAEHVRSLTVSLLRLTCKVQWYGACVALTSGTLSG